MNNSCIMNGWCINHNHKYIVGNKTAPFIRTLQAIIYQLSNHHSQQYINYHCYFTVVLCVHVIVLHLFYIFHKPIFIFQFQTKDDDTHTYAQLWLPNSGDKKQQNNKVLSLFLCNMFLYWLTIPFIHITFFY